MKKNKLFDTASVSLNTDIEYVATMYSDNARHISISGAQEKLFAVVDGHKLRLARDGEQSTYIIKPIPNNFGLVNISDMPANECLTMKIASQVYGLDVAPFGLIRLADNNLAYIVRRFDVFPFGKFAQEDVCALLGRTAQTHGSDFKYKGSYLEVAEIIRQYVPLWRFDIPKFVSVIIFNYLFSNGDAHLKNFSLLHDKKQFRLSPAYDLLNTSLHIRDSDFALSEGLGLSDTEKSDAYIRTGHPTADDFRSFAQKCGLTEQQIVTILAPYLMEQPLVATLCNDSDLSDKCKRMYIRAYMERITRFLRTK